MAKGGINLSPGADPVLVAAATRAAMANVPKDLSGTFENLAQSYATTMQSLGQSWSNIISNVGEIGEFAVKAAMKSQGMIDKGSGHMLYREGEGGMDETYEDYVKGQTLEREQTGPTVETEPLSFKEWVAEDPVNRQGGDAQKQYDDYKTEQSPKNVAVDVLSEKEWNERKQQVQTISIGDELTDIRKGLNKLFLKTDKESRIKRNELRQRRDQLYSDIQFLENADNFNDEALTSENVNFGGSGQLNLLMKNALSAYKTKTGVIQEGPYKGFKASLTRNVNDQLSFILQDVKGNVVTGVDHRGNVMAEKGGEPFVVSTSDMNQLLVNKIDPKVKGTVDKMFLNLGNWGAKNGTVYRADKFVNELRPIYENENNLHNLIRTPLGMAATSFEQDLTSQSVESAKLFKTLGDLTAAGSEVAGDIVDTNNDNQITQADFIGSDVAEDNYLKVVDALLNRNSKNYKKSVTTEAALDHAKTGGENMFNDGMLRRQTDGSGKTKNPFGTKSLSIGGGNWLSADERWNRRKIVKAGKGGFTGIYGDYAPTKDGWTKDDGSGPKPVDFYKMMQDEHLLLPGDVNENKNENENEDLNKAVKGKKGFWTRVGEVFTGEDED